MKVQEVPIWQKMNLTIEEAAQYSNIGVNRIRKMLDNPACSFVLNIGERRKLVKRKEFEEWNRDEYSI